MKLSNKILIGFFGIILVYTLMSFIEIRIKGEPRYLNEDNSISETSSLKGVQFLVIAEELDTDISISSSDTPQLELKSKTGQALSKLDFELINDTLFLNGMDEIEEHFYLSIQLPKSGFNGMEIASGYSTLNDISQPKLSIKLTGGSLEAWGKVNLQKLNVSLSRKANATVTSTSIDTVTINLNNSTLRINDGSIINGSIENDSGLYTYGAREVQLKRDKSSRMQVY